MKYFDCRGPWNVFGLILFVIFAMSCISLWLLTLGFFRGPDAMFDGLEKFGDWFP